MLEFCQWLENTQWATAIHQSLWLFPLIETAHLFGIILLVGATAAFVLRLMGRGMKEQPVSTLAGRLLPWAWAGLTIQVVTGLCLFSSEATRCWENNAFRIKMVMLVLAGLNALIFHQTVYRRGGNLGDRRGRPGGARGACRLLVGCWVVVLSHGPVRSYLSIFFS